MVQTMPQNGSTAPSIKDQSPESESFLGEVPDPDKVEAQSTNRESTGKKITIDAEFYKRVGFYSAFNKSSEQEFRQALEKLHQSVEQNIKNLTKELNNDLERFSAGKTDADTKIGEIKTSLTHYQQQVDDLKGELVTLKGRSEQLRGDIRTTLIEIGARRKHSSKTGKKPSSKSSIV